MEPVPVPRAKNQQRIAVNGTPAQTALTPHILGQGWLRVRFRISTAPGYCQFYFGVVSDTIALDATGGGATVGYTLETGQSEDFYIYGQNKYTHIIAVASGAGFIDLMRAGRENTGRDVTA